MGLGSLILAPVVSVTHRNLALTMLGARGGPSAAKKKNATPTSQASKAKGGRFTTVLDDRVGRAHWVVPLLMGPLLGPLVFPGGGGGGVGGRVGDIRSFMVERPNRLDEYNPKLRYRLVRTGKAGNVDLVSEPRVAVLVHPPHMGPPWGDERWAPCLSGAGGSALQAPRRHRHGAGPVLERRQEGSRGGRAGEGASGHPLRPRLHQQTAGGDSSTSLLYHSSSSPGGR